MRSTHVLTLAGAVLVGAAAVSAQSIAVDTFGPGDSFDADLVHQVRGPNSAAGSQVATAHLFEAASSGAVTEIFTALRHESGVNDYTVQLRLGDANHVSFVIGQWIGVQAGSSADPLITIPADGSVELNAGQTYWLALIANDSATGGWHRNDQNITGFWATSSNQGGTFFLVNGTALPAVRITLDGPPPCPPDWNGDGVVDSDDLFDFLSDWAAGNADYNGDGVTDSDDLFDFLSDWSAGC